eukprot:14089271-Ditylum_brightwellii.AAC.1
MMTVTDQGTGFLEIWGMKKKKSRYVAHMFDMNWLCRYLRPEEVIHNNGDEFIGKNSRSSCIVAG